MKGNTFLGLAINKKHINKLAKILNVSKNDILYNIEFKVIENINNYGFDYIVNCEGVHALQGKKFDNKFIMEIVPGYKIEYVQ